MSDAGLPLQPPAVHLPAEPEEPTRALAEVQASEGAPVSDEVERGRRLRALVAADPAFVSGWAALAEWALQAQRDVEAYAYARTGYHRGLDRMRKAGWRGQERLPWSHEPNRGCLRSVRALMAAAAALGETDEAERTQRMLLELDPGDPLDAGAFDIRTPRRPA